MRKGGSMHGKEASLGVQDLGSKCKAWDLKTLVFSIYRV